MEPTLENEDATNLADVENDDVLDQAEVADDQISEDDLDTSEEAEDGQPEDDTEEIDHDGKKYKVPKDLKDSFLRQADYTVKTQALAEDRKALAARATEIAQQAEVLQATASQRANLALIDQQLETFRQTDWSQYDPQSVAQYTLQWQQLRDAKADIEGSISQAEQQLKAQSERFTANAVAQAEKILAQEIPNWGQEVIQKTVEAGSSFGFTAQEIHASLVGEDGSPDTRSFKVLTELSRLRAVEAEFNALKAKQTSTAQASKLAAVKPAATVGGRTNGYKPGLDDSLPADEWMRRRNAQIAKARGR